MLSLVGLSVLLCLIVCIFLVVGIIAAPVPRGTIVVPTDGAAYESARLDYNANFSQFPVRVVLAENVAMLRAELLKAKRAKLPIRIRCGRHSYESYCNVDGGVVLDVTKLNAITVDQGAQTAWIGAGARLLQVYSTLTAQGFVIPGGSCTSVGISGLTLGGGFGLFSRDLGLTIDSLIGVEMLDYRGKLLRVDATHHADLFWALRGGGGGNLGIVSRFQFRLHPVEPQLTLFKITYAFSALRAVFNVWQTIAPFMDNRVTCVFVAFAKERDLIYIAGYVLTGSAGLAEATALVTPFLTIDGATPTSTLIQSSAIIDAIKLFDGSSIRQRFKNTSAFGLKLFPSEAIDALITGLSNAPAALPNAVIGFDAFGGRISNVGPLETAFFWRNALFDIQYQAYWSDAALGATSVKWVEDVRNSLSPWTSGAYVNYLDSAITDYMPEYYGDNAARLRLVKARYDPQNLFSFPQSVAGV